MFGNKLPGTNNEITGKLKSLQNLMPGNDLPGVTLVAE